MILPLKMKYTMEQKQELYRVIFHTWATKWLADHVDTSTDRNNLPTCSALKQPTHFCKLHNFVKYLICCTVSEIYFLVVLM